MYNIIHKVRSINNKSGLGTNFIQHFSIEYQVKVQPTNINKRNLILKWDESKIKKRQPKEYY